MLPEAPQHGLRVTQLVIYYYAYSRPRNPRAIDKEMATAQEQIKTIIKELTRLQTVPTPYWDKDDEFPLPRMIGLGNGSVITVSRKIDDTIVAVADQLMTADPSLSPKVTRAEWRGWFVRRLVQRSQSSIWTSIQLRTLPSFSLKSKPR